MGRRRKEGDGKEEGERSQDGFFACYLLCSLCPRHKARTYIGFTVNPRRRIRQHNGEIRCGALRTKKARPWEMVLCIYGFPSNITALQFEWAWQHPTESLAVRKAASNLKSLRGLANKIKLAYTMLNLPSWDNLNLTVNFFSTKYAKFTADCPELPNQMKFTICAMDELPCYSEHSIPNKYDENYERCQQPNSDSMDETENQHGGNLHQLEEIFSPKRFDDGSSDNNYPPNQLEIENYETCQEPNFDSMDGVENQKGEKNMVQSDGISSPKRLNEEISSNNTRDGILSPENNVIDLVTPLSCVVRSDKMHRRKIFTSMIDLTSSPCVIEL